jgi:hypothetical protein
LISVVWSWSLITTLFWNAVTSSDQVRNITANIPAKTIAVHCAAYDNGSIEGFQCMYFGLWRARTAPEVLLHHCFAQIMPHQSYTIAGYARVTKTRRETYFPPGEF